MTKKISSIGLRSNFFRVLSDPTRFSILMLLTTGELCVCQIEAALGARQAKISRHLAYLRKHKIVKVRSHWKWKYYSLLPSEDHFEGSIFKCLGDWLEREKPWPLDEAAKKAKKC